MRRWWLWGVSGGGGAKKRPRSGLEEAVALPAPYTRLLSRTFWTHKLSPSPQGRAQLEAAIRTSMLHAPQGGSGGGGSREGAQQQQQLGQRRCQRKHSKQLASTSHRTAQCTDAQQPPLQKCAGCSTALLTAMHRPT